MMAVSAGPCDSPAVNQRSMAAVSQVPASRYARGPPRETERAGRRRWKPSAQDAGLALAEVERLVVLVLDGGAPSVEELQQPEAVPELLVEGHGAVLAAVHSQRGRQVVAGDGAHDDLDRRQGGAGGCRGREPVLGRGAGGGRPGG